MSLGGVGRREQRKGERQGSGEEMREWKGEERRTKQMTGAMGIKCALWYLVSKSIEVSGKPTPGQAMAVPKA